MKSLELNKFVAAILTAALIGMLAGNFADILYKPDLEPKVRGYEVEVVENVQSFGGVQEEVKFEIGKLMASANLEKGEAQMKKCSTCHTVAQGGPNRVGPNLYEVLGRKKGAVSGFAYSDSLIEHGGDWDYEALFKFLYKPKQYIKGTKMGFAGVRKHEDIADIVAYLRSLSSSPKPLPAADTRR